MQLNQFKFLIAIDRYGSISRAAQELYLSQSTISQALIHLEEELGYVILNRSKRGVTFTPEGKEVLKRAYAMQQVLDSLKNITGEDENIFGDVRMASNSHLGMNVLTDAMLRLHDTYTGIHLSALARDRRDILKMLAQNDLDLAFVTYHSLALPEILNDLKRLELEQHVVYRDKMAVCTRRDHPLTKMDHVRFKDVANYERVTMSAIKDSLMLRSFGVKDDSISIVTLADVMNLRKYATMTDAVVILPGDEAVRSGRISPYKLERIQVEDFNVPFFGAWFHHVGHQMNAAESCVTRVIEEVCRTYTNTIQ
jgi:DNA-binding transcriptional LysR family regulator